MKRVYTLYRVSTKRQVDVQKDDIPMQRIACHGFVERMPDWVILKEFEEKGVSGYKVSAENRDAIQDLKEAALNHEFDILLVFMFDRLGRMENETPFVLQWFVEHGIEMWSVQEGEQKIANHVDKLMNYIRFWQASGESQKTSVRVKTRLHQMTSEGIYTGGVTPFGYELVHKGRVNKKGQPVRDLVPKPGEFEMRAKLYEMVLYEGYGSHQLARFLTESGYKTVNGANFTSNAVLRILKNPISRGIFEKGGVESERIPELQAVSDTVFFGVMKILEQRNRKNESKRTIAMTNKGRALLSGNIYCAHCGCRLATSRYKERYVRNDGTVKESEYGRYVCYHRSRGLNDCDGASTYKSEKIDSVVIEVMRKIFANISGCPQEEQIQSAYKKMIANNLQMQKKLTCQLQKDQAQLITLQGEIAKALIGESLYQPDDLSIAIKTLRSKIEDAEKQLQVLKNEKLEKKTINEGIVPVYHQFKTWAEEFDNATLEVKKMIANQLFSRVEVGKGYRIHLELNITYQQFCEEWISLPSFQTAIA